MIRRSTLVFLTILTALTLPVASLSAKDLLIAQSSVVDPDAAVNTDEAIPNNFRSNSSNPPLQDATSEQQRQEIKVLQQELKNRGYYDGPVDGIYGPMTAEAISTLRGQQDGQPNATTPRLFTPDSALTETPSEPQQPTDDDNVPAEAEGNSVRIDAENATVDDEDINIGDQVSPETGTDSAEPEPATSTPETAQTDQADAPSSPGLGRLLWPGLALIAVFGSFGIGFFLANRSKTSVDNDTDTESAWGSIPDAVPQTEHPSFSEASLNGGQPATNGSSVAATEANNNIVVQSSQMNHGLPVVSTPSNVSATTRLAKVDVIDELVANLQVAEPSKRRKAIWELGQRGNSSAVQHLVNSMVDADSKEKSLILAALSEIGIRSLKPMNRALAIALQDDSPDVRKNAIRDLTRVYEQVTQISQMLGHATEDQDPEVRRTAEWALEQLNRIREAPKLKSSLSTLEASRSAPELLPDDVKNLKN